MGLQLWSFNLNTDQVYTNLQRLSSTWYESEQVLSTGRHTRWHRRAWIGPVQSTIRRTAVHAMVSTCALMHTNTQHFAHLPHFSKLYRWQ